MIVITLRGYVVSANCGFFGLVMRKPYARFVRKVFARGKLLPGKFWVFVPLEDCFNKIDISKNYATLLEPYNLFHLTQSILTLVSNGPKHWKSMLVCLFC